MPKKNKKNAKSEKISHKNNKKTQKKGKRGRKRGSKNKPKVKGFYPTPAMQKAAAIAARPEMPPVIVRIMDESGLDESTYYKWVRKHGDDFEDWWTEAITGRVRKKEWYLDKIALVKASQDFNFWKALQMKYFKYAERTEEVGEKKEQGITIIFDGKKVTDEDKDVESTTQTGASPIDIV